MNDRIFPATLDAALALVWDELPAETKTWLQGLPKEALRDLEEWETLLFIRNITGLNAGNTPLLAECAWVVRLQYPLESEAGVVNHFYHHLTMREIWELLPEESADLKPAIGYLHLLAKPDIAAHVILEGIWAELQKETVY